MVGKRDIKSADFVTSRNQSSVVTIAVRRHAENYGPIMVLQFFLSVLNCFWEPPVVAYFLSVTSKHGAVTAQVAATVRYSRLFLILSFGAKPCAHPLFRLRCERIRSRASELSCSRSHDCIVQNMRVPSVRAARTKLVKLFKKPKSKFYWYDFTVRGRRYRVNPGDEVR